MPNLRTYTQEGYDALLGELEFYKAEREKNKKEISEARAFGDLSENSEYDEAKNRQAQIATKLEELEELIKNAVVQNETDLDYSKVSVGSIVEVYNETKGKTVTYNIVGSYEADPFNGMISDESPIGIALRGHGAGDTVTAVLASGKEVVLTIKKVEHRSQQA